MSDRARRSPSPSESGYALNRRRFLRSAAGAAGVGLTLPPLLGACGSDAKEGTSSGTASSGTTASSDTPFGNASGELTIGSNYSNELPQAGLAAAVASLPNDEVSASINEVDHNTFQENITTYLQNPDDVVPWFAGYRMRFFADQGLLGDITDVWDAGLSDGLTEGFKTASTADDGKQYFVPWTYYTWGVYYRPSLFDENGWSPPTDMDELMSLASDMQDTGLVPFAFANDGQWPAMGTFDLAFRTSGLAFGSPLFEGGDGGEGHGVELVGEFA